MATKINAKSVLMNSRVQSSKANGNQPEAKWDWETSSEPFLIRGLEVCNRARLFPKSDSNEKGYEPNQKPLLQCKWDDHSATAKNYLKLAKAYAKEWGVEWDEKGLDIFTTNPLKQRRISFTMLFSGKRVPVIRKYDGLNEAGCYEDFRTGDIITVQCLFIVDRGPKPANVRKLPAFAVFITQKSKHVELSSMDDLLSMSI